MIKILIVVFLTIQTGFTANSCAIYDEDIPDVQLITVNFGRIVKTALVGPPLANTFMTENVTSIVKTDDEDCPYVDVYLEDDRLLAKPTDAITNIDQDLIDETVFSVNCGFNIKVRCEDGSELQKIVMLYIDDVNVNQPQFEKDNYEFTLVMPFGPYISITGAFKTDISVTDVDFSTSKMKFELLDSNNQPSTLFTATLIEEETVNKTFYCDLSTSSWLNIQEDLTLILRATDDGTDPGPKLSEATITIKRDETNSDPTIDPPEFGQTLTEVEIAEDPTVGDVIVSLSITSNGLTPETTLSSATGFEDYFAASATTNEVQLKLSKMLDSSVPQHLLLTIEAWYTSVKKVDSKRTTAVVFITNKQAGPPQSCSIFHEGSNLPLSELDFGTIIKTAPVGVAIDKTFITKNVISLGPWTCPYACMSHSSDRLEVKPLDTITNIDIDLLDQSVDQFICESVVEVRCSDGTMYQNPVKLSINDFNTHQPKFEQSSYNVTVAMPFPKSISLTNAYQGITAQDIDFSTKTINCKVLDINFQPSPLFTAVTVAGPGKTFGCNLVTNDWLDVEEELQLIVMATDDGVIPGDLYSQVGFKIIRDSDISLQCPVSTDV